MKEKLTEGTLGERMRIKKVNIENFKCFNGKFTLDLNRGVNILVGNNESGKSTILEAIHLALSGILNGRYLRNELSQYLFNNEVIERYLSQINNGKLSLPHILIEIFFDSTDVPMFEGNGNREKEKAQGLSFKIEFDESYQDVYEELIKTELETIPIEYYKITWKSFARSAITSKSIPIKSVLIDSSAHRYQSGSDIYISRIIKNNLNNKQKAEISQAYREMKDVFNKHDAVNAINDQINEAAKISTKTVKVSVDLSTRNAWETSLITCLDEVPFHQIGKGEQCIVKTNLALAHKKNEEVNLVLLEEPENHLSYSKLNEFVENVIKGCADKQMIVSTHSSFVANKLGLENLILLNNQKQTRLSNSDSYDFFKKLSGYETLRLILCKKVILVEGDSDELIVQKAFMESHEKKLPIQCGIDVISVKLTFKKFLQIADKLDIKVVVMTDNDGDVEKLEKNYKDYIGKQKKPNITIFYDGIVGEDGGLKIGKQKKPFNYNTLEPKLLKENNMECFNKIFGTSYTEVDDMHKYMRNNKVDCALKIFESLQVINYPQYIKDVISWCDEE